MVLKAEVSRKVCLIHPFIDFLNKHLNNKQGLIQAKDAVEGRKCIPEWMMQFSSQLSITALISFIERYCCFDLIPAFKKYLFIQAEKEEEKGIESKGRDFGRLHKM